MIFSLGLRVSEFMILEVCRPRKHSAASFMTTDQVLVVGVHSVGIWIIFTLMVNLMLLKLLQRSKGRAAMVHVAYVQ